MKTLIVFYSRTGNTKKVAEELGAQLNADLEFLKDKKNRSGILGWIVSCIDSIKKMSADIEPPVKDVSEYDIVFIGTPIWAGKMTPAVRTYINMKKEQFKNIAVFTTQGSTSALNIVKEIETITNKKISHYFSATQKEIKNGSYKEVVKKAADSLVK